MKVWPIDRTLLGATTLGQSELGSNGKEGVHCISQSCCIIEASPWDCLMSHPGHSLGGVLSLCIDAVGVFYSPSPLGWWRRSNSSQVEGEKKWGVEVGEIVILRGRREKCAEKGEADILFNSGTGGITSLRDLSVSKSIFPCFLRSGLFAKYSSRNTALD